ncbi:MAG: glycosyltransferase family 2 protein [Planctomycetota bacterium]|nr:glycosyltransferase family 2 protein [Planctomycetota bacterium]
MATPPFPRVSVVLASRNEQEHIEKCLTSLLTSELPEEQLEIVVADGMSTDRTREVLGRLAAAHPCVRLVDNPERIAPMGFNRAIKASRGDTILLTSAHTTIEPAYLPVCLAKMEETGADIVGGAGMAVAANASLQARLAAAVLGSRFGVGSSFRTVHREGFVDTVSPALYHRSVFERLGLFDERLIRNQDNEFNSRLRRAGGRIYLTPAVNAYYIGRDTIWRLMTQNYRNGLYAMLNWRITPASFAWRHVAPALFVLGIVAGGAMALLEDLSQTVDHATHGALWMAYAGVLAFYALLAIGSAVQLALRYRTAAMLLAAPVFPLLHVAYGLGTAAGVLRFGFVRLGDYKPENLVPRPGA